MTDYHPFLGVLRRIGVITSGPNRISASLTRPLSDDDWDDIVDQARGSLSTGEPNWGPPGKKLDVITTNSPKPAVLPGAPKKARSKPVVVESLREKRARLRREIADLEGKRGKN